MAREKSDEFDEPHWKQEWLAMLAGLIGRTNKNELVWERDGEMAYYHATLGGERISLIWFPGDGVVTLNVGGNQALVWEKGSALVSLLVAAQRQIIDRAMHHHDSRIMAQRKRIGGKPAEVTSELVRLLQ